MQHVFNIAKRQWETDVHHHCELDDFGRRLEIAEWDFAHELRLGQGFLAFKLVSADNSDTTDAVSLLAITG